MSLSKREGRKEGRRGRSARAGCSQGCDEEQDLKNFAVKYATVS